MRVLIIPEDFRKDQYILKPIIEAMMKSIGKPRANVRVCQDHLLGSVSQALNLTRLREIVERYRGMVDLFLLCVDRDGEENRWQRLADIEQEMISQTRLPNMFFAVNAWQELEVWVLAGHTLPKAWKWSTIRAEIHPKEKYFEPFARQQGVHNEPGGGRKTLAQQAAGKYSALCSKCSEDLADLEMRIKQRIENTGI